jgi:osmoprotectant transport system permease protein
MNIVTTTLDWFADGTHWDGPNGIPIRLFEHVTLSGASMLIAVLIALPAGFYIGHTRRGVRLAVGLANLGRAVPTLAAITIVLPITSALDPQNGFRVYPTVVAMVLLASPPILVNAYTGISQVDTDLVEAARGMGMQERQLLRNVEIPIAIPVIIAGIRSAAVQVIATATLGAIFGFGGLGRFLVDGIANQDAGEIYGGVVLVGALALSSEAVFALVQRALTSPGLRRRAVEGRIDRQLKGEPLGAE